MIDDTARRVVNLDKLTYVGNLASLDEAVQSNRHVINADKIGKDLDWRPREAFDRGPRRNSQQWYLDNHVWVEGVASGAYRKGTAKQYGKHE